MSHRLECIVRTDHPVRVTSNACIASCCVACATDAPGTRGAYLGGTYAGRELRTFVRETRETCTR